jgi:hypothetical protein
MGRRSVAKLKWALCSAVVGTVVITTWPSAQAAPLATISMEGRKQGDTSWSTVVVPAVGDVVEYRLLADLAPVGTTNGTNTITSLANSGIQSLSLAIVQAPSDKAQVDFNAFPAAAQAFRNGWGAGTGASVGALSLRTPGGWNDVRGIRPILAPGVFSAVDPEVILLGGTFTVVDVKLPIPIDPLERGLALLWPTWGTGSGALRINGAGQIFITPDNQAGADPLVAFRPLVLTAIPEPATVLLSGVGLAGVLGMILRRRVNK